MSYRRGGLIAIALAPLLVGCISGSEFAANMVPVAAYGPVPGFWSTNAFPSGYSEERVSERTWKVRSFGTTVTPAHRVALIAEVRAAELGKLNGYSYFKIVDRQDKLTCASLQGGSTNGGLATAERTVAYATTSGPDFISTSEFFDQNIEQVRKSATAEDSRQAHLLLRATCDALKARREG